MQEELHQQFFFQTAKAKRILIVLPESLNADLAGSATALALFLGRQNKEVDILSPENYEGLFPFLPKAPRIFTTLETTQSFVVVLNTTEKPLDEISYVQEAGKTKIFLKSKAEQFAPEDIHFESEQAPYELLIILGVEDLSDLGESLEKYADLLYGLPKVNIDNQPGNKHYGAINIVDINSPSVSEIVSQLMQGYEEDLINEDIATSLLTGIMVRTHSFQHSQVTPKSFMQAGILVEKGARQQEIIKELFKTKPLAELKLLGRALARLQLQDISAYAVVYLSDFKKSDADEQILPLVLRDLQENLTSKHLVAMLVELPTQSLKLLVAFKKGMDMSKFTSVFGEPKKPRFIMNGAFSMYEFTVINQSIEVSEAQLKKLVLEGA